MRSRFCLSLILLILYLGSVVNATTYYVSKGWSGVTASDANNGTNWSTPWLTLTNLNNTAKFGMGDTVFFGAGTWRAPSPSLTYTIIANPGTSATDRTCYADSLYWKSSTGRADTTAWAGRRVAWIYGSDSLPASGQTWTLVSGNVYSTPYTSNVDYGFLCMFQGDQVLYGQSSQANVNLPRHKETW